MVTIIFHYKKTAERSRLQLQIKRFTDIIYYDFRGVAQLVAYVLWEHGVAGSNPVTSTILKIRLINSLLNHLLYQI